MTLRREQQGKPGRGLERAVGEGRGRGRLQPYAWLRVGAVGLGAGAVLSAGAGVAYADGGRGDSSASRSADARSGSLAAGRGGPRNGRSGRMPAHRALSASPLPLDPTIRPVYAGDVGPGTWVVELAGRTLPVMVPVGAVAVLAACLSPHAYVTPVRSVGPVAPQRCGPSPGC